MSFFITIIFYHLRHDGLPRQARDEQKRMNSTSDSLLLRTTADDVVLELAVGAGWDPVDSVVTVRITVSSEIVSRSSRACLVKP